MFTFEFDAFFLGGGGVIFKKTQNQKIVPL